MAEQRRSSFETPYKFNGKELDANTRLYYYGARYYNPRISNWLSVDPLAEKFPGWSPYNYTMNNPINMVDPDGRAPTDWFKLLSDGTIVHMKSTNDNFDILFTTDFAGNVNNGIRVNDTRILPQLRNDPKVPLARKDFVRAESKNAKEVASLYTFLAKNSKPEWGLAGWEGGNYTLTTDYNKNTRGVATGSISLPYDEKYGEKYKIENLLFDIHSHEGTGGPSPNDPRTNAPGDFSIKTTESRKYYDKTGRTDYPRSFIFSEENSTLTEYKGWSRDVKTTDVSNGIDLKQLSK